MSTVSREDLLISAYDSCPFWSANFAYAVLAEIDFSKNAVVLDMGTGTGFPSIEIADRMGEASVVYGIDEWEPGLKRARVKAEQLAVSNVIFQNASVLDMPFGNGFFDLAVSNNCLNNVAAYDKALGECFRVLKPGGRLIQTFNLPETMKEFYDVFRSLLVEKEMAAEIKALENHIFERRKTTAFTINAAEKSGFRILKSAESQFVWPFYNGTSMLNYSDTSWLSDWQNVIPEPRRAAFFVELEERLNAFAKINGGLKLTIPYSIVVAEK